MLQLFLLLHVLGAIVVFGPTFAFPIIAGQAQKSPQNGPFAALIIDLIERRIVIPGAIVQGVTGVALILILNADLSSPAYRWLGVGIVLYIIAIAFAVLVQAPATAKMVELTKNRPAGPPPDGAPAGPPPEVAALGKKLQRGGILLSVLIVSIVFMMVVKPSLGA
ncbi:MAG TPA: DUF2269 family protein [Candidatus Limnocylindrales bacterium]|jgi:hypothetical protein